MRSTQLTIQLKVITNHYNCTATLFILPIILLVGIFIYFSLNHALQINEYVLLQKNWFFYLNNQLGRYASFQYNTTQLGDALIFLSILSMFIVYAPKMWEALLTASLLSLIISNILKTFFAVPRPSVMFNNNNFIIIGHKVAGLTSLPSGHAITVFTTLTVLLFSFMPRQLLYKFLVIACTVCIGTVVAFTRVAVGAHYPFDVIIGSIIGYSIGLMGIIINKHYPIWGWINKVSFYPIFIILLLGCSASIIHKIYSHNLVIFYVALACLFFSLFKMIYVFIKKKN